jgi:DNA-binding transcriptional LysR family regulator
VPGEPPDEQAWRLAFQDLESRALDMAIIPTSHAPLRFHTRPLYDEDFVIAMRAGHPFARRPTLERYCEMQHLVVSLTGDTRGFVDKALAKQRRSRRIALTVPNFAFALALVAETELICAIPRKFVVTHGSRFGIVFREPPLPLPRFSLHAVAPKAALMDAGLKWLFEGVARSAGGVRRARARSLIAETS